jgi:putative NADH-flavin reductase
MEITVFGASGAIGSLFVHQALRKGHKVKAYVRNPSKVTISHPNIVVVKGELNEKEKIKEAVKGSSAVVSLLGPPLKRNYEGTPIVDAHTNIISAMRELGVKRVLTLATPSVKFEKDKKSLMTIMPAVMGKLFLPKPYKEIVTVGEMIKTSGLDWTVVRIIAPNDKAATGNIKVSFGSDKLKMGISRADIATFFLKEIEEGKYIKSMPIIGS